MDCSTQVSLSFISRSLLRLRCVESWYHPTILSSVVLVSYWLQSFPASGSFQMSEFFTSGGQRNWSFRFSISPSNEYSGLISFRIDWLGLLEVQGPLKSSPIPQFKSINSLTLKYLYGPTLTSVHDYWKKHRFDYMDLCRQRNIFVF